MIILRIIGYAELAYLFTWILQYIWGMIGFFVLIKASGYNETFFIKVLDRDNKDKTKYLLSKWPVVLYRMKKSKRS